MTKKATKPAQKPDAATPDISAMAAMMIPSNTAAAKVWAAMMTEATRFLSQRLQEDIETQKAMLNCKHPAEIMEVQSEFFRTAVEQYSGEAQKLFDMMSEATQTTLKEKTSGQSRNYDDLPL